MLQPKPKFTPPSDAVVVESESSFVPPSDAIEIKKKEPAESTSTTPEKNLESVQKVGSSDIIGSDGVSRLKPDLKTAEQSANPPKSKVDQTKSIKKFEGLIPDKTKGFYQKGEENVGNKAYIDSGFKNKTEYVVENNQLAPKTKTTYVSEATKNLKANYAKEVGRKSISEYDPNLTEENLQREKEQSGVLNTLGKVGKYVLNATGESLSALNEAFGGDEGYFTIDQYKPLQDQKTQAKSELQREGLPITEEAIQKRAEDIFRKEDRIQQIQKRVDANLPEDYDREGIWKELKLDNLKNNDKLRSAVATIDINKKQIDDFNKYAAYINSLPKEKVTQEKVDKYNKLLADAQDSSESLEYYKKSFPKLLKEVKSSDELLDVMKFNYDDYEKAYSNITGLGKTIAMGSLKLAGETANYTDQLLGREGGDIGYRQEIIDVANEELDKNRQDKEQFIRYKAKDISSFSDGGSFMAQLGTEQLPVYATLLLAPEIGLPLLGTGTAGEQFRNMEVEEMQPFAKQTTFGQKLATAYLYGSAETLFERLGTVGILKNIEKSIARASNASRRLIYEGAAKESTKLAKRLGLNTAIEGGTEYLTAEAQIGADRYVSGKNISSQQANERRFESTVAGGLMGGSMTLVGGVWGSIAQNAKLYSENKDIKETKAILSQIDLLSNELKNNPNLTTEDKKIIYDKMNDLTNKSFDIVIKNSEKGKNFSAKENQFLVDINVKQDQLKQKFEELKNSNISKEQKELLTTDLNNQYKQLEKDRNSTLKGEFETIPDIRKIITFQKKEEDNLKDDEAPINKNKLQPELGLQEETIATAQLQEVAIPDWLRQEYDDRLKQYKENISTAKKYLEEEKAKGFFSRSKSEIKYYEDDVKFNEDKVKLLTENPVEFYKQQLKSVKESHEERLNYDSTYKQDLIDRFGTTDFNITYSDAIDNINGKIRDYESVQKTANENAQIKAEEFKQPTQEQTNEQKVEQLRADEQAELKAAFPNAELNEEGKIDKEKLSTEDQVEFNKIYDKYDKPITRLLEAESKKPSQEQETSSEQKIAEIEKKRVETEAKIKRKDLFTGVGEFSTELGDSDKAAVPVSRNETKGIEFVEYAHPDTGSIDVIVSGKSDNDFVGFYRLYENGKPTNKWSSKFENKSRNKEDFKTMISGVQELLPEGHQYTEKTSISTDGLRVWNQQLNKGYELQYDANGNIVTNTVAINGDAIVNELGVDVNKGNFENIKITKEQFETVKKALLPYLEKLGLNESNIRYSGEKVTAPGAKASVQIDLPILVKSAKGKTQAEATSSKSGDVGVAKATETTEDSTSNKFEKSLTLLKEINAKQGVDARNAKRERNEFLKENPTIKYIDDNYKNIIKQLEKQGLFKQLKDC